MSRYGFDLDGTLDRPALRDLCNALYDAGHQTYVITGGFEDSGEWTEEARRQRLADLGVRCTELRRCIALGFPLIAELKKRVCEELKIDVYFDDMVTYLEPIQRTSTVCLRVLPS